MAAVNPKKLKAYMAAQAASAYQHDEDEEDLAEGEGYEGADEEEGDHHYESPAEEAEQTEEEEAAEGESPEQQAFEDFIGELFTYAEEISSAASEVGSLGAEALAPEVKAKIKSALSEMPDEVADGFKAHGKSMTLEDAEELAEDLAEEGKVEDAETFAMFVYWAGKVA
jgi:hypothetical protein